MSGSPDDKKEGPKKESKASIDPADIDSTLKGRTLKTYLFMIKNSKPVGVRELQRNLGLSSPSVAYHHLEKLERMGLVEKNQYGEYVVLTNVDVSVLQAFSHIGSLLIPRFTFYAMLFTTLLVGYLLLYGTNSNIFATVFGILASAFAWYETVRTWKKRPF
ncbi:MAG: helix-turn-helix domain-containing protein [Nitrososphaerales archaeon]